MGPRPVCRLQGRCVRSQSHSPAIWTNPTGRLISENFVSYIEGGDESIKSAEMADSVVTPEIKINGYFIYPSQLFANVAARANRDSAGF